MRFERRVGLRRAQALSGGWQRLWHGVAVLGGWVVFVVLWRMAMANQSTPEELRRLVVGASVVTPLLTVLWVAHNVGIYLRKGPRTRMPPAQPRATRDFNGRQIRADWDALRRASWIEIEVQGDIKHIRSGEPGW